MTTIRTANHTLATGTPRRALNIALWTLQTLAALTFVAAGSGKVLGSADMIALFDAVGIGQWFRYVTGSLEGLGALLLIVPGKAAFGAVLLACVMAGAVVAHLTVLHTAPTAPLVLFVLTALIGWGRRSQLTTATSPH
jgi:putative oxidoreductase